MRREQGTTLLELLIAITMVALLVVGMLFAMRVGFNTLDATNRKVLVNRRTTGAQRILQFQVAGFMPVMAQCGMQAGPQAPKVPFLQADPAVMRFVTSYSLAEAGRGMPRVIEIFIAPGEDGRGVRLLANEYLFTGPLGAGFFCSPGARDETGAQSVQWRPAEVRPSSFVLADKLAGARFLYQVRLEENMPEIWAPRWVRKEQWPTAVRIEMAPLERQPDRVQPVTFTAPIRVTRQPREFQ